MREYINGLQHIGIPTKDIEATIGFYESIGFEIALRTKNGPDDVAFLRLGGLTIETYTGDAVGKSGAIDHIALDVSDVEKLFALAKKNGYKMAEDEIQFLSFWDNGVRYFNIVGPNGERVEFSQML